MPRIAFTSNSSPNGSDELPFLAEYVKTLRHDYEFGQHVHPVGRICVGEKGLLLLTSAFKVFLWKRSSLSKQLLEAAAAWVTGTTPIGFLYVMPINRKGQMELGIDTDYPPKEWRKEETENYAGEMKVSYFQVCDKALMTEAGYGQTPPVANPFLNPNPPSPTTGYSESPGIPTKESGRKAASRKP